MSTGRFHSAREAKDFVVSRIVKEAALDNVKLSEIERKMLYFSETDWTLPDMSQVNAEFDRDYDQDEYETKIGHLIVKAVAQDRKETPDAHEAWLEAVRLLEKEDHYILVMINASNLRPRGDQLKLFITGLSVAVLLVSFPFLSSFVSGKYGIAKYLPSGQSRSFYLLVLGLFAAAAYRLGWLTVGKDKN